MTDISNNCINNSCVNGTCVEVLGGYSCDCDENFTGFNCSIIGEYNKDNRTVA